MSSNQAQLQQIADYVNNALTNYPAAADLLPISADTCAEALHDGVLLSYLMNSMSTSGPVIKESDLKRNKATLFHKMDQVNRALEASKKAGLNIINVRAEFIVEKKQNAIIGLFNQITRQKPGTKIDKPKPKQAKHIQQPKVVQQIKTSSKYQEKQQEKVKHEEKKHQEVHQHQSTQQSYNHGQAEQFILPPNATQETHSYQKVGAKNVEKDHTSIQNQYKNVQQEKHQVPIQINQCQLVSKQSESGYKFEEILGPQIVVLCGSLRRGSVNKGIVNCLESIKGQKYFQKIHFHIPDLGILPLMNEDLQYEGKIPKAVFDLQQIVRKSSGILISTPEYNGSFSAIVKNAFDWLSKPYANKQAGSPLQNKKIGIVSTSFLTQNQIKDTIQMGQNFKCNYYKESFYIPLSSGAFKMEEGRLVKQEQIDRLAYWYQEFSYFILSGKPNPEPSPRFIMA